MAVKYDPTGGITGMEGPNDWWNPLTWGKKNDPTGGGDAPNPGRKPGDVVRDEFGEWVEVQPDGSLRPYRAPSTAGDTSAQTDGAGVAYVVRNGKGYRLDGTPYTPVPVPVRDPNRPSQSFSVSQSIADPASIAIQRDNLNEQIRQALVQEAKDQQTLQFNRDKLRVETEAGDKNRALDTQRLMEQVQARLDSSAIKRQELQQQLMLADRQIAQADRQMAMTARENALNRQQRAQETQQADRLARDKAAAEYAASPTDVGRMSAILNRGGLSNISTAIGQGDTAISDKSLEPLAALLYPDVPTTQQPTPGPLTSAINAAQTPEQKLAADQERGRALAAAYNAGVSLPGMQTPPIASPQLAMSATSIDQRGAANARMNDPANPVPDYVPRFEDGGAVVDDQETDDETDKGEAFLNGLMELVQRLGMKPKAIAGEKGKANGETVYSNGDVVVMPDKGKGMPEMAMGGAVMDGLLNPRLQMTRDWLAKVQQDTLARSGFDQAPTPIEVSDPGTDPYRQQLAAAVTGQLKGINPQSFLNEAMRLRPQGMQRGYASRSR